LQERITVPGPQFIVLYFTVELHVELPLAIVHLSGEADMLPEQSAPVQFFVPFTQAHPFQHDSVGHLSAQLMEGEQLQLFEQVAESE
jgi:hypothetical protein